MKLSGLLADLRLMCQGMPEPLQYRVLTRALQRFLAETEVWTEWTEYAWDNTAAAAGLYAVPNSKYNPTGPVNPAPTVITNRVHAVKWLPTGENLSKCTVVELDRAEPDWMTQTDAQPRLWLPWPGGYQSDGYFAVRVYPHPASADDDTAAALKFQVSHTVAEAQSPEDVYQLEAVLTEGALADWLFRRYRDTILAGAVAYAWAIPRQKWSDRAGALEYGAAFTLGIDRARSEAQAGQTTSSVVVDYGGY